jgi:hypothetical protein
MSTPVVITIPHRLGKAEARQRVNAGLDGFKAQLAGVGLARVSHGWTGDRLSFHAGALGQAVTGRIDVNDDNLRIEIELPALLSGLANRIAGQLERQGRLLLEKK